jgi:eukaryotic-like serine/threonine-protein kinase
LLERLGEGGWGTVYLAQQEYPVRRAVAVKVLKHGLVNHAAIARFEVERQALALMSHPNIASIFDAGATADGRPYFVMELVRGGSITEYCDEHRLPLRQRLELFVPVCQAVQHAHQKGIIHRDLKPSNILITVKGGVPVPKVIDFGVAKALDQQLTEKTCATLAGQFMGTPAYMSPEHIQPGRAEVDTRSDVYSLGLILYELLAGRPPLDWKSVRDGNLIEFYRLIVQQEPVRPSTAVDAMAPAERQRATEMRGETVARLSRALRGDLDSITMRALEKEPARRYETAAAFAEDISRFLSYEPVLARPPSRVYQLRRLAQRNTLAFAAASVAIAALVGGVVVSLWQLNRALTAEREQKNLRIKAETETKRATAAERRAESGLIRTAVALAEAARREGDGLAMRAALNEVPEGARDATWDYLFKQADNSIGALPGNHFGVAAHPLRPGVFAIAGVDAHIEIVNVRTGERLLKFQAGLPDHSSGYGAKLAFSPDGKLIAVGRQIGTGLAIHRESDGRRVQAWNAPTSERLVFSHDGELLMQSMRTGSAFRVWRVATGDLQWSLPAPVSFGATEFTPDGQHVLAHWIEGGFRLLKRADGTLGRLLGVGVGEGAVSVALHPDGRTAVATTDRGLVQGFALSDGRLRFAFHGGWDPIRHLAYSPDGERFVILAVTASGRQSIQVRDANTGALVQTLMGGSGEARGMSVHPLSGELVVTGENTRVWTLIRLREAWTLRGHNEPSAAFWGSDDLFIGPPNPRRSAGVFALKTHGTIANEVLWQTSNPSYRRPSVSADGQVAAIGRISNNDPIFLLRRRGAGIEPLATIEPRYSLSFLRLSPSGDRLAICVGSHGRISVLESSTGKSAVQLDQTDLARRSDLVWTSDGRQLLGIASAKAERGVPGSEEWVILWDAASGHRLKTATHPTAMNCLAIPPNGRMFAEAGEDKRVRLRDQETLAVQREFRAHDEAITALAWHPTQPVLASGSADFTVKLWNIETGRLLEELGGLLAAPTVLTFSPSGRRLACAAPDGVARVWEPASLEEPGPM